MILWISLGFDHVPSKSVDKHANLIWKITRKSETSYSKILFLLIFLRVEDTKVCKSCGDWRRLQTECWPAKISFDTAENEPSQIWGMGIVPKKMPIFLNYYASSVRAQRDLRLPPREPSVRESSGICAPRRPLDQPDPVRVAFKTKIYDNLKT